MSKVGGIVIWSFGRLFSPHSCLEVWNRVTGKAGRLEMDVGGCIVLQVYVRPTHREARQRYLDVISSRWH